MMPTIAHLWGPLYIRSYGLTFVMGLLLCIQLIRRHPRFKQLMESDQLINGICVAIISGIIGGRILYLIDYWDTIENWYDVVALWQGGLSSFGAIITILATIPLYLRLQNIPILPAMDLGSIYAPLLWSIARLGCLLAGCCHGIACSRRWAITFSHPEGLAPLHLPLHPTQLYSSIALFGIWLLMVCWAQYRLRKPGQLLFLFLLLTSIERFMVDFWRDERPFITLFHTGIDQLLSLTQWIALGLMGSAVIGLYITTRCTKVRHS